MKIRMQIGYLVKRFVLCILAVIMMVLIPSPAGNINAQVTTQQNQCTRIQVLLDSIAVKDSIILSQREEALIMQEKAVAYQVKGVSNPCEALAMLLEVLPPDCAQVNRPYTSLAASALHKVITSLDGVDKVLINAGNPIAFSADGDTLYTGEPYATMYAWDIKTGKKTTHNAAIPRYIPNMIIEGGEGTKEVTKIMVSPDSTRALKISKNRMHLWDITKQKKIRTLHGRVTDEYMAVFTPNGERVVTWRNAWYSAWDTDILWRYGKKKQKYPKKQKIGKEWYDKRIWDAKTGEELFLRDEKGKIIPTEIISVSPNGENLLIMTLKDTVSFIEHAESGLEFATFDKYLSECNQEKYRQMRNAVFSPDGKKIAWSIGTDVLVYNTDFDKRNELQEWTDTVNSSSWDNFSHAYFDLLGNVITYDRLMNEATKHIWDVETGKEMNISKALTHKDMVSFITPKGKHLLSDKQKNSTTWVDATDVTKQLGVFQGVYEALSDDEQILVTVSQSDTLYVWDMQANKVLCQLDADDFAGAIGGEAHLCSQLYIEFTNDGSEIMIPIQAKGTYYTMLWDVHARKQLFTVKGTGETFSIDDKVLVTEIIDTIKQHNTYVWDMQTGLCSAVVKGAFKQYTPDNMIIIGIQKPILKDSSSNDAVSAYTYMESFVTMEDDSTMLWNLNTQASLLTCKGEYIGYNVEAQKLLTEDRDSMYIWDVKTGNCQAASRIPAWNWNYRTMISPDAKMCLIYDKIMVEAEQEEYERGIYQTVGKVVDIATGREVLVIDEFKDITFNNDGTQLIVSTHDNTYILDLATGRELLCLEHPYTPRDCCAPRNDVRTIVSPTDKHLLVYNGANWHLFDIDIQRMIERGHEILNNY